MSDRIAEAIRESAWTGCDPTRISNARTLSEAVAAVVHPRSANKASKAGDESLTVRPLGELRVRHAPGAFR